jgi:hypothetical protein
MLGEQGLCGRRLLLVLHDRHAGSVGRDAYRVLALAALSVATAHRIRDLLPSLCTDRAAVLLYAYVPDGHRSIRCWTGSGNLDASMVGRGGMA